MNTFLRNNYGVAYVVFIALAIPWQRINVVQKSVTPFHVINAVIVLLLILPFLYTQRVRLYFFAPLFIYMLGSFIGMFNSEFVMYNLYTIGQDLYLYVWFLILSVVMSDDRNVKYFVLSSIAALVIVIFSTEGTAALTKIVDSSRLEFSFRNPNRASAYFTLILFLLAHPSVPWVVRAGIGFLAFRALLATGSAGGLLGLGVGVGVLGAAWFYVKYGVRMKLQGVMAMCIITALLIGSVALTGGELRNTYSDMTGMSGSRVDRSASVRKEIWRNGLESFRKEPFGIGPGSFWQQAPTELSGSEKNVELHSDWVGTLAERGFIGMIGLVAFVGAIGVTVIRMLGMAARHNGTSALWAGSIAAAISSYVVLSLTHEVLHHETLWLLLAIMMGTIMNMRSSENTIPEGKTVRGNSAPGGGVPELTYELPHFRRS